jgi:hypothetical protein
VPEASIFWPVQEMSYEENCLTQYQAGWLQVILPFCPFKYPSKAR